MLLCCLGLFLCLPATTSYVPGVPSAHAEANNVGHVDPGAKDPASLPDGSYPLTSAEEAQETDKAPVSACLLTTMLVLAFGSLVGASVGWLLMTNARRRGALVCSVADDDGGWSAVIPESPSLLGVFRL